MQKQDKNTNSPDSNLGDGKSVDGTTGKMVRPKSTVMVMFRNSKHHGNKPYHLALVHPALAEKLVEAGKAEYTEQEKLTKDQIKENSEYDKKQVVDKGRTPGKVTKADEDEFDDDFNNEGDVMGTKNTVKKADKK